jgi:hypothetical protein
MRVEAFQIESVRSHRPIESSGEIRPAGIAHDDVLKIREIAAGQRLSKAVKGVSVDNLKVVVQNRFVP